MTPTRRIRNPIDDPDGYLTREWLVANGQGGYASGTVSGILTRRYHGLLVAALPAPVGRLVMLSSLGAQLRLPSDEVLVIEPQPALFSYDPADAKRSQAVQLLCEFRLEGGLPVWSFEGNGYHIEKRVVMPHRQNTVHITFRLLKGAGAVRLELRPFMHFRHYESPLTSLPPSAYKLTATDGRFEVIASKDLPRLRLHLAGHDPTLTMEGSHVPNRYVEDQNRGYEHEGTLWTPGNFRMLLDAAHPAASLVASTESWEVIEAAGSDDVFAEERRRRDAALRAATNTSDSFAAELTLAADQFIITPTARPDDRPRAAHGEEARTVIAGYHWFTDWGRDTMISLEGLTLATGRHAEAALILRTFAGYVRDGLIPNMFPDGEQKGLYHTADATLWFFHALSRYLSVTGDRDTLRLLLPVLRDIVAHHVRGTRFGIGVDPKDGLLKQGEEGYQLTWMDAKVDGWVVTPRRGKAVEINALFYNALRLLETWVRQELGDTEARLLAEQATLMRTSFNERFWYEEGGYLYDVVDGEGGNDPSFRPNQILALSLPYPVLDDRRWEPVVEAVRQRLLTPYGLRSLEPGHPDFRPKYYGDLRSRDAAYHQGTVWAWLIGPFVDAWLRVYPGKRDEARRMLESFQSHLDVAGVGSISEIFDAEPPYIPRGCIAQAWSVAEVLRTWNLVNASFDKN